MRTIARYLVVLIVVLCGCAAQIPHEMQNSSKVLSAIGGEEIPQPKLTLSVTPKVGFSPARFTFKAVLENVADNDTDFLCAVHEWQFGDGAVSAERPNCIQPAEDAKVAREFFVEHLYEESGSFRVRFYLGDRPIISNAVVVSVVERYR